MCPDYQRLLTRGNPVINIAPGAVLELSADFSLGHNLPAGSRAETYLKLHEHSTLIVNGYFKAFYGSSIEVFPGGALTLGGGYINCQSIISCSNNITIGEGAAIARGVFIYDSDRHKLLDDSGEQTNISAPVVIGGHVWIGVGAIILKGVTIGDGAVIGAGAVVTSDIPANSAAAGNPARVIRQGVIWE
jgi:acetyltransferase-like isoleucine patch superfamily enzyme